MKVLVLYDSGATYTNTVREHLESFDLYSKHRFFYTPATSFRRCHYDLDQFDALLIHYSVRLCYDWHISPSFVDSIRASKIHKALLIQDEYDNTAMAKEWIRSLGIDTVFTVVPEPYIRAVYPEEELPGVRFVPTLTGWVSTEFERNADLRPLKDRENWIHYRGRMLPFWYGDLAREKWVIGERMKKECEQRGVPCDIEWTEDKRIYGDAWTEFIKGARATLGSESGANIFDEKGEIRAAMQADLAANPDLGYDELHRKYLSEEEGRVKMNQVSPRIFEAAALGTGMVLFRGGYSGVVQAEDHFIPLEKDFSNVDEVFERLDDLDGLEKMVRRARADVIDSGAYSYRSFVETVDQALEDSVGGASGANVPTFAILEQIQEKDSLSVIQVLARTARDLGHIVSVRWEIARKNPRKVLEWILAQPKKIFAGK